MSADAAAGYAGVECLDMKVRLSTSWLEAFGGCDYLMTSDSYVCPNHIRRSTVQLHKMESWWRHSFWRQSCAHTIHVLSC